MSILDTLINRARQLKKRIVLCEGQDLRVLSAAARAAQDGIADVILVSPADAVRTLATENHINLDLVKLIDPTSSPLRDKLANELQALRHRKGMTAQKA